MGTRAILVVSTALLWPSFAQAAPCRADLRPEGPVIPAGATFADRTFHWLALDYYSCLAFRLGPAACEAGTLEDPKRPKAQVKDECRVHASRLKAARALQTGKDAGAACRELLAASRRTPDQGEEAFCSRLAAGDAAGACAAMGSGAHEQDCLNMAGALWGEDSACARPADHIMEGICRASSGFRKGGGSLKACREPLCRALAGDSSACEAIAAKARKIRCVPAPETPK